MPESGTPPRIPPGPYYTAPQAADKIGVSLRTLARWDTLEHPRGPKRWRFDANVRYVAAEVDRYAALRRELLSGASS